MTDYRSLRDSDWLGQWDLEKYGDRGVNVTIRSVTRYKPEREQKKRMADGSYKVQKSKRIAIAFDRCDKAWLSGPVSQDVIASLFGKDIEKWIGRSLNLYVDPKVEMGGKTVGGIRCRNATGKATGVVTSAVDEAKRQELDEAAGRATGREPGEEG